LASLNVTNLSETPLSLHLGKEGQSLVVIESTVILKSRTPCQLKSHFNHQLLTARQIP
jgi:hypothetical protein